MTTNDITRIIGEVFDATPGLKLLHLSYDDSAQDSKAFLIRFAFDFQRLNAPGERKTVTCHLALTQSSPQLNATMEWDALIANRAARGRNPREALEMAMGVLKTLTVP